MMVTVRFDGCVVQPKEGKGMNRLTVCVAVSVACFFARSADLVIKPSETLLWSTASGGQTVSIPILWPEMAATATLSAPASGPFAGVDVALTKANDAAYALTLPEPVDAGNEYVVTLTLSFFTADGTALTPVTKAAFGVVCAEAEFHGADETAEDWGNTRLDRGVIPLPGGAADLSVVWKNTAVAADVTPPCRWVELLTRRSGAYEVSVVDADGVTLGSAELAKLGKGLLLLFR